MVLANLEVLMNKEVPLCNVRALDNRLRLGCVNGGKRGLVAKQGVVIAVITLLDSFKAGAVHAHKSEKAVLQNSLRLSQGRLVTWVIIAVLTLRKRPVGVRGRRIAVVLPSLGSILALVALALLVAKAGIGTGTFKA